VRCLSPVGLLPRYRAVATAGIDFFPRRTLPTHSPRAASRMPGAVATAGKAFNTQSLVPAQFNEFYPKCSGTTILCPQTSLAEALRIESSSLSATSRRRAFHRTNQRGITNAAIYGFNAPLADFYCSLSSFGSVIAKSPSRTLGASNV
jgi:hypothetical protein